MLIPDSRLRRKNDENSANRYQLEVQIIPQSHHNKEQITIFCKSVLVISKNLKAPGS